MKLHSARGTWTLEGMKVYSIPAGRPLNAVEMQALHRDVAPGSLSYQQLRQPSKFIRFVLLKPTGTLVLVPMTPDVQQIETV